jgi:orotate phosphoribosyltransferase
MTPKEKAIEIYTKMYNEVYASYGTDFLAKQCALIAVNEILSSGVDVNYYFDKSVGYMITNQEYYQEVKQEIEKL